MANTQPGLIGRKVGMTQLFQEDGTVLPVTVLEVGPNTVLQVKTKDTADKYDAVQLGFGGQKKHRVNRPQTGHYAKSGNADTPPALVREIRVSDASTYEAGQKLGVSDVFATDEYVDVTGTSKGRGFAGVMKRHNFRGFIRSHGTHEFFRHGGSIGTRLTPGHVLKGKKMPGHMGSERVTIQNLRICRMDNDRNLLFVKGGVPGPNGGYVTVRKAVKK